MQINSVNSPAFGCGACTAAYKKAEQLSKIKIEGNLYSNPHLIGNTPRNAAKYFINKAMGLYNKTHGQAASYYNQMLGERIKKLSTQA